jgi:hypothetical protein
MCCWLSLLSQSGVVASHEQRRLFLFPHRRHRKGLINKTFYDNLGRTTKTIENYVDGTPSDSDDRTTLYTYTNIHS